MILGTVKRLAVTVALLGPAALAGTGQAVEPHSSLSAWAHTRDSLYVGDVVDNSVKRFDAATGKYRGVFVSPGSGGLDGPRGILFDRKFLVSNQNVDQSFPGEIDQYNRVTGIPVRALVPHTKDANPPFDPDGIIRGPDNRTLYVADLGCDPGPPESPCTDPGRVATYNVHNGHFLGNLDFGSIKPDKNFKPRGLVFGPHGVLYISIRSLFDATFGRIVSWNPRTGAVRVVASSSSGATDCSRALHRPDGLTFGPDGRLYVTSFRADANDVDRILIFNPATGACTDEIDLDQVGQPRAYAQYILFGPRGYLFAPIIADPAAVPPTGSIRRYDVKTKTFINFVAPGGPLSSGWGLTFGRTDPVTLAYSSD